MMLLSGLRFIAVKRNDVAVRIVAALVDAAEAAGCYKVILDCAESNTDFYAKSGFKCKEIQMVRTKSYLDVYSTQLWLLFG